MHASAWCVVLSWAALGPALQDASAVEKKLTAYLEEQGSTGYYTADQVRELAALTSATLGRVSDPATRARLLQNTLEYAAVNHASKALVRVVPDPGDDPRVEVLRPPSAWALYTYELEKRLSSAISEPKTAETISRIEGQMDRLIRASDLRLAALLEGPGADEYRKEWAARFRQQLAYYAATSLELLLPRPLSEAELKEAEHRIATFSRADAASVRIDDPRNPPYAAGLLTDFGILSAVQIYLYELIQDGDTQDEKYMALARQMKQDLDVLQQSLKSDRPIEIPGKDVIKSYPSKVRVAKGGDAGVCLRAGALRDAAPGGRGAGAPGAWTRRLGLRGGGAGPAGVLDSSEAPEEGRLRSGSNSKIPLVLSQFRDTIVSWLGRVVPRRSRGWTPSASSRR
jgi:hypothetical protein